MRILVSPTKETLIEAQKIGFRNFNKLSRARFFEYYQLPPYMKPAQALKAAQEIEFKELMNKNG